MNRNNRSLSAAWQVDELQPDQAKALTDSVVGQWQDGREGSRRRRLLGTAAAALMACAAVIAAMVWQPAADPVAAMAFTAEPTPSLVVAQAPTHADQIEASDDAQYAVRGPLDDRVVELVEGRVRCVVEHRPPGGRFRVLVGSASVEVTGTRFEVVARDGILQSVRVEKGQVVVRSGDGQSVVLDAGERWASVPPRPAPNAESKPAPQRAVGAVLRRGLKSLDSGDAAAAAKMLGGGSTRNPLHEDREFWRGIAQWRADDREAAAATLAGLLIDHPSTARAGVIHCLLGQHALGQGERDIAREHFSKAKASHDPKAAACGVTGSKTLGPVASQKRP